MQILQMTFMYNLVVKTYNCWGETSDSLRAWCIFKYKAKDQLKSLS